MKSIRASFVLAGALGVGAVLAIAALLVYWSVDRSLRAQHDEMLRRELGTLTRLVEYDEDEEAVIFDVDNLQIEDYEDGLLLVRSVSGELLFTTVDESPPLPEISEAASLSDLELDGRELRLVAVRVLPRVDEPDEDEGDEDFPTAQELGRFEVFLGRSNAFREPFLASFRRLFLAIGIGAALLNALLMAIIGRGSLRGLGRLARAIEELHEDELATPVSEAKVPSEALPIVRRLNALLARVEAAVRRERELSADIAHELRTPLAGMRTTLEVGLQLPRDPQETRQILGKALEIIERTETMVERLLQLHRAESGQTRVRIASVDLAALVDEQLSPLKPLLDRRRLTLERRLPASWIVQSSADEISILLAALLENAVSHSDEGGWIRIEATEDTLRIGNSGSRVHPSELSRLTERFARGDQARAATNGHAGLGLTLASRVARILDGELRLSSEYGGEFWVSLRLR